MSRAIGAYQAKLTKKGWRVIKLLVSLLFVVGLGLKLLTMGYHPPPHVKAAEAVMRKLQKQLLKEYEVELTAVDTAMMDCVRIIGYGFTVRKPYSLEDAQRLVIEIAEKMLRAFNEDQSVRPYLLNYPFNLYNITLALFFTNPDGSSVYSPYPTCVSLRGKGNFSGWYLQPPGPEHIYLDMDPEPYETVKARLLGDSAHTAS